MSDIPILSRKYTLLILESVEGRGSATYYDIGSDIPLARRSSLHPVIKRLQKHEPSLLDMKEGSAGNVTKFWYSLTTAGKKALEEAQQARLRDKWVMSPQKRAFVEAAFGALRLLSEEPMTAVTLAERLGMQSSEAMATLRRLRLGRFISIAPDNGSYAATELGRDFLDGYKRLTEGLEE